ncbi:MAG TPA: hypothetical protein VHR72_07480 [Gemmataceae bacterium]|nr:hypothetical protein [Gemmataceae bacterium]
MARYLAIDWNPPQLQVLAVDMAKGHARAVKALAVPLDEDLTPASAERIGKKLRDALKAADIGAAPALWTIGRDRIVLKELTIPPTPVNEEPAIVRFQVTKESTEPMSDAVIDYTYAAPPQPNLPRKVLVVVGRKSVVQAIGTVCAAAGLKSKAVTPRAFAASGLLSRKGPATGVQAVLLPTGGGTEFLVFRGADLAWARAFPSSANLTAEVRRTLLLLAGQNPDMDSVERVLAPPSLDLGPLPVPVEPLDPWLPTDQKPEPAEAYLAPLGLAEASRRTLPINLAAPKEPTATVDHGKQRRKAALFAAAVLVPLLFIFGFVMLSKQRSRIKELAGEKDELDAKWKSSEQARADVDGLKDWEQTSISWIDELYDIAARFPHETGLRLSQVSAAPLPHKLSANGKDKFVGVVTLRGVMQGDQDKLVSHFMSELRKDPHLRVTTPDFPRPNEFTVRVEVAAQPGSAYKTHLEVPPQPRRIDPEEMPNPFEGAGAGAAETQGVDPEDEP